jgi:hypothetical protein
MYALISHHDDNYKSLGKITWEQNKLHYAKKHGYAVHCRTDNFVTASNDKSMTGFEKIYLAKKVLDNHPKYKWIWWTGTDSMVTNMNIRIEDRIFNDCHFIISTDVNGINADSWLIRNSDEGHEFLRDVLTFETQCLNFWDTEQRAIAFTLGLPETGEKAWAFQNRGDPIHICEKWKNKVRIVPQKYFNSYIYNFYGSQYPDQRDRLGVNGNWSYGDWLVHWPGTSLQMRLQVAVDFQQVIVN